MLDKFVRYTVLVFGLILCGHAFSESLFVEVSPDNSHVQYNGRKLDVVVVKQAEMAEGIQRINEVIQQRHFPIRVLSCDRMVRVSVPVQYGNNSYGGTCVAQAAGTAFSVYVCADDAIGHLAFSGDDPTLDVDWLITFVAANCVGG